MQIFNIGPLELIFILILALIVLGPENIVNTGKKLGQWLYRMVRSPLWATVVDTSKELREIPERLMRDSGIEESMKEVQTISSKISEEAVLPAPPHKPRRTKPAETIENKETGSPE